MAAAHRTQTSNSGTGTQLSIAKAGLSGLANGDVVYIACHKDQGSAGSSFSAATGTNGWTKVKENLWSSGGRNHALALFRKVMTDVSSEPSNWQFDQTTSDDWSIGAWAVTGANLSSPEDGTPAENANQNSGNPDPAAATANYANEIVYVIHGSTQLAGSIVWGAPSGYTQDIGVMTTGNSALQVCHKVETTTGSKDPGVFTNSNVDSTGEYIVWTLLVRSAAGNRMGTMGFFGG